METVDREQLLRLLSASRKKLLESAEGLTDEQARMRPAEDRWSILECVEHVGLVEDGMFATVTTKLAPPESSDRSRARAEDHQQRDGSQSEIWSAGVREAGREIRDFGGSS